MPDQRFTVQQVLADNGTSQLVRAVDQTTGGRVIVRLHKTRTEDDRRSMETLLGSVATLKHPNVETIHWVARQGEDIAAMTEEPQGELISDIVVGGPLSMDEFRQFAAQSLAGLAAAHERGIVHGALSADRFHITRNGATWLTRITGFGVGFGNAGAAGHIPAFLCVPPEQWEQQPARRRSDVYSLGCVFYRALSGKIPFDGKSLKEVRHKHLQHDLRPLHEVAPQAPRWLCDWVMSLLAASPDARPATATVAVEAYRKAEAQGAFVVPAQPVASAPPPMHTTGVVPVAARPPGYTVPVNVSTLVTLPPQRSTMPVQTRSAPVRPVQVSRPPPAPAFAPAAAAVAPVSGANKGLLIAAGIAVLGVAAYFLIPLGGKKDTHSAAAPAKPTAPPIKVVNVGGKAASSPATATTNELPLVKAAYPPGRSKPAAYPQLVFHAMSDAGVLGPRTDPAGRLAAFDGEAVLAWTDFAERARDSTLYTIGGSAAATPTFVTMRPDAAFPLAGDRKFVRFTGDGTPPAALTSDAKNQAKDFPFGTANPPDKRGLTLAVVFFQEVRGRVQTLLHLGGTSGSAALRLGEKGEARLQVRRNGLPETDQPPALAITADQFNPLEPLLLIATWRASPAQAILRLRSASGKTTQTAPVQAPAPADALTTLLIGHDPETAGKPKDPETLRAFAGGIAEILIHATTLGETELAALEKQLADRYFPKPK